MTDVTVQQLGQAKNSINRFLRMMEGVAVLSQALGEAERLANHVNELETKIASLVKQREAAQANLSAVEQEAAQIKRDAEAHANAVAANAAKVQAKAADEMSALKIKEADFVKTREVWREAAAAVDAKQASRDAALDEREAAVAAREADMKARADELEKGLARLRSVFKQEE